MESESLKPNLQPGDFILIQTPGTVYNSIRKTLDVCYDHMSVLLDKDTVFHISPPTIRKISSNVFLMKKRNPIIIRPNLTSSQRDEFIKSLENSLGYKYDYSALFYLLGKKLYHELSRKFQSNEDPFQSFAKNFLFTKESKDKKVPLNICTDLLFSKLQKISPEFSDLVEINKNILSFSYLGSFSPDDLLVLSEKNSLILKAFHGYPDINANVFNNSQNFDLKESEMDINSESFQSGLNIKKIFNIIDKVLFISNVKQSIKGYRSGISKISKNTMKNKRELAQTFKLLYLLFQMRKILKSTEKKSLSLSQTRDLLKQGLEIYLLLQDTELSDFLKRPFAKSNL